MKLVEDAQVVETPRQQADQQHHSEVRTLSLDAQQSALMHCLVTEIASHGAPQDAGTSRRVAQAATELLTMFDQPQTAILKSYANGQLSSLVVDGMAPFSDASLPAVLPPLPELEARQDVVQIGVRSQLLLKLVDHLAFAYDIDNEAKIVRVVANLKGGGDMPLADEPEAAELSSHSGLALGPHTEAPYWCAVKSEKGRSPSPSSLILSALWNPGQEPTSVIPLPDILKEIGVSRSLALATPWFQFTRSDSFVNGLGEDGSRVSILSFDEHSGFAARFNSYRFSVMEGAPASVKEAFQVFSSAIARRTPFRHVLSQSSAILINNVRALHCRDIVRDNRRTLIRLFGYSKFAESVVYSHDPLLVRG